MEEDTPYRRACRRSWARLIAKLYLVSSLICPKCQGPMKILSFLEDEQVVRKILQHLKLWDSPPRLPPKKIIPPITEKPMDEDSLPWAADPISSYDNLIPCLRFFGLYVPLEMHEGKSINLFIIPAESPSPPE